MDRTNIESEDEGKQVVNSTGDSLGMVTEIKDGVAHVDPDPGLGDSIRSRLGWNEADQEDYTLTEDRIHTITDDEIRLKD